MNPFFDSITVVETLSTKIKGLIEVYPDFPKKGIQFKDISGVLRNPAVWSEAGKEIASYALKREADLVAGVEARGFIIGVSAAVHAGLGFIPVRKAGKLPGKVISSSYTLEYGTDSIEVSEGAIRNRARIVVVDDVLATGVTMATACTLVERAGGIVVGCAVMVELEALHGREVLKGREVFSLVRYQS